MDRSPVNNARVSGDENEFGIESGEKVLKLAESRVNNVGFDSGLHSGKLGSDFMGNENGTVISVGSSLNGHVQSGFDTEKFCQNGGLGLSDDGFNGINLVVDLNNCCGESVDGTGNQMNAGVGLTTEKEGEYKATDLVWGKVGSHPWWPGVIFDPSASTIKARKYYKKDGFLIAYFGDQTFAWNEASKIKPFHLKFCEMEKQSHSESFCRALACALDEVSRRVQYGLACACLSEEAYSKVRSQVVSNAGVRKECSIIEGGDEFSLVASFNPATIVQFVQDLAKDPLGGISRLEVSTVRAQLTAFDCWKGYCKLAPHEVLDGSDSENGFEFEDNSELQETAVDDAIPSGKGKLNSVSQKGKLVFDGDSSPNKKLRCLSDLMSNGEATIDKASSKRKQVKLNDYSKEESQRIVRQPSGPRSILNKENQRSKMPIVYPSAEEILSCISLTATNPMEEPHILSLLAGFLSDFRNYGLETNPQLGEDKNPTEENTHRSEVTQVAGFKGVEDSYWTDRIIQIETDEPLFTKPKSVSPKPSKGHPGTALILKFTNLESVPSAANLNAIFSAYGPLRETETDVFKKNNCAKVVFERRPDAETAFSSAGKFSLFGPSLISYCLDYSPTPRKTGRNQKRKGHAV